MKKCKKCGTEINKDDLFCAQCGEINKNAENKKKIASFVKKTMSWTKKHKVIIVPVFVVVVILTSIIVVYDNTHCQYSGCDNKSVSDSDYCYDHKCKLCEEVVFQNDYCFVDYYLYSDDSPANLNSMTTDIKISNITLYSEYSYTYAEGRVTNYGSKTYDYVKVKGAFKSYSGTVIDTDWTYAVGSEGLAPGESKTFKLSVPKDYSIQNCTVTIIDD